MEDLQRAAVVRRSALRTVAVPLLILVAYALIPVRAGSALRTVAVPLLILVAYALIPVRAGSALVTVGATLCLVIAAFAWVLHWQARRIAHSPSPTLAAVEALVAVVVVFVLSFALVYVTLSVSDTTSFTTEVNKVAGVYLSVTVLTTVGFGDIAAVTDLARVMVTVQMLADLILLATAGRVVMLLAERARQVSTSETPPGPRPE